MKVQYDLEGAVIEQPKGKNFERCKLKLKVGVLLLVILLVASAVGTIVFQYYYERHQMEVIVNHGTLLGDISSLGFDDVLPDYSSQFSVEHSSGLEGIEPETTSEFNEEVTQSEEKQNQIFSNLNDQQFDDVNPASENYLRQSNERDYATWEGSGILGFKFSYDNGIWNFGIPAVSEEKKGTENDIEDGYQEVPVNIETAESDNVKSIFDVPINSSVNPLENFGLEATIMQFELNEKGLSVKYGDDENDLKELQYDSGVGWLARLMLYELFLATEQSKNVGSEVKIIEAPMPTSHSVEEILNWNFDDDQIGLQFRYADGLWTFEPTAVEWESLEANIDGSQNKIGSLSESKVVSSSEENGDQFNSSLDSNDSDTK